jgi:hypothetical protein
MSDQAWRNILGLGDSLVVIIKHGNYKRSSGAMEQYYIQAKQKAFIKIKGIDTLYYVDYTSDTSSVINVAKIDEHKNIAGQECNALILETTVSKIKYFYAPSLYMNPEYDQNNKIGRFDAYVKEVQSIWLAEYEERKGYSIVEYCTRIAAGNIKDTSFILPDLPQKEFSIDAIVIPPKFSGSAGWIKYLQVNLNSALGAKYVKIPKGEEMATQTAIVTFVIDEKGRISKAKVINENEVHPKLAEEALRVINASPIWKPATVLGEKFSFYLKQPITFAASKK